MNKLCLLILFAPLTAFSNGEGVINKVERNDSVGVYLEKTPYINVYGNQIYPDSFKLFWTCNSVTQDKMQAMDYTEGDTLWFKVKFLACFITAYFPETLWEGGVFTPAYADTQTSSVSFSTNNLIYDSGDNPFMNVNFQNPAKEFNATFETNAVTTRVIIVSQYSQVYYKNFDSQSFSINRQFPPGIYQLWVSGFYPGECTDRVFWRFKFVIL